MPQATLCALFPGAGLALGLVPGAEETPPMAPLSAACSVGLAAGVNAQAPGVTTTLATFQGNS